MEYRLTTGEEDDESTMVPHMRKEEDRLQTFSCWPSTASVRPQNLAQAGLFYVGEDDWVQCFCCGGMLGVWEEGDTAWGEHTKHFPDCFFILGHDVGNIPYLGALEEGHHSVQQPIDQETLARTGLYSTEVLQSDMAQRAIEMGREPSVVEMTILEKIRTTGSGYTSLGDLLEDCLHNTTEARTSEQEGPLEKLQKLQWDKKCKICMDRDIGIVLIPCGHLVACRECSVSLVKCPICCRIIKKKIMTYIA